MEWILCLGHAVLGALLLPFAFAGPSTRRRAVEVAAPAGIVLGLALVVAGESGAEPWRTVAFDPRFATPAGVATAAAWLVAGAQAGRGVRVEEAALAGVASSGLVLAATGRWVVPALLFWLCSSVALAVAGSSRAWTRIVLAASDAALCGAAIAYVWRADAWSFGDGGSGAALALSAAAVIRGGAHFAAPWPALGSGSGAAAPLMAGGAVVLAARAGGAEPWFALVLLLAAVVAAAAGIARESVGPRLLATWTSSVGVAVCLLSPGHAPVAGTAVVLAVAAAALWPHTAGRGGMERAVLVSAVPLTAGFGMVAAPAAGAFERAADGGGSIEWSILAAVLPATLAVGVVLGARAARADVEGFVPEAVVATWLLAAAALAGGVLPGLAGEDGPLGDSGGTIALQVAALAAGLAAGVATRRWAVPLEAPPARATRADVSAAPDPPQRAAWGALALGVATGGAAAWLTVAGLRVGFL